MPIKEVTAPLALLSPHSQNPRSEELEIEPPSPVKDGSPPLLCKNAVHMHPGRRAELRGKP